MSIEDLEKAKDGLRNVLYNTQALNTKCVAFCWHHHKWLTINQLKTKRCLERQCNALEKRPEHTYWEQREYKKKLRKERKERLYGKDR